MGRERRKRCPARLETRQFVPRRRLSLSRASDQHLRVSLNPGGGAAATIIDRIAIGTDNKCHKGSTQASEGARNETLVSGGFFGSRSVVGCAR
jgi:hypothetical protein